MSRSASFYTRHRCLVILVFFITSPRIFFLRESSFLLLLLLPWHNPIALLLILPLRVIFILLVMLFRMFLFACVKPAFDKFLCLVWYLISFIFANPYFFLLICTMYPRPPCFGSDVF